MEELKIKTLTEMKNSFDLIITTVEMVEQRISVWKCVRRDFPSWKVKIKNNLNMKQNIHELQHYDRKHNIWTMKITKEEDRNRRRNIWSNNKSEFSKTNYRKQNQKIPNKTYAKICIIAHIIFKIKYKFKIIF